MKSLFLNLAIVLRNGWIRLRHGRRPYRYLLVRLRGSLDEARPHRGLERFLRPERPRLLDLVTLLEQAAEDPVLEGVLLEIGPLSSGWGRLETLEEAIARVRESGKEVIAFLESAGNAEYRLAASANRIHLHPTATLDLVGLKAEVLLFGEALSRLGVQADILQVGDFKSAAESFTRSSQSPAARKALGVLLDDLSAQLVERIAAGRGLEPDAVQQRIDEGPYLASAALDAGLVDRLSFRDEVRAHLLGEVDDKRLVSPRTYRHLRIRPRRSGRHGRARRVAWIPVVGTIRSGSDRPGGAGSADSETVVAALERARKAEVDAAVLRIDSPGGSGLASDVIWREVARLAEEMPVVVSMGDKAASGGYYVAAPAASIVTASGTLTGSIGVFGGKFSAGGLYERLGIGKEVQSRGRHADLLSDSRRFSAEERRAVRAQLEAFYETFLERVSSGRGLERDAVHAVAQGRVWTGRQAVERGLADRIGGVITTLDVVRERLEVPPETRIELVETAGKRRWPLAAPSGVEAAWSRVLPDGLGLPRGWVELAETLRPVEVLALLGSRIRIR